MKTLKTIIAAAVMLALAGCLTACHSITIPTAQGPVKVRSFGQKTRISEVTFTDGTLKMKGYNNDQVTGMVELFNAGVAAGKSLK